MNISELEILALVERGSIIALARTGPFKSHSQFAGFNMFERIAYIPFIQTKSVP